MQYAHRLVMDPAWELKMVSAAAQIIWQATEVGQRPSFVQTFHKKHWQTSVTKMVKEYMTFSHDCSQVATEAF